MKKEILLETGYNLFKPKDSAKVLAEKTLAAFFGKNLSKNNLPINPFAMLKEAGVYFVLLDFENLDGFYKQSAIKDKYALVGIKSDVSIERQRFTAAHELCHHLKDSGEIISLQGSDDQIEIFANQFASHLLMPASLVKEVIEDLKISNEIDLDKILEFSMKFGVSYESAFIKLNNYMRWGLTLNEIRDKRRKFKPNHKKRLNSKYFDYEHTLLGQIISNYDFFKFQHPVKLKNDFLKHVVTHDHMIENGTVSKERISEIISLLRIKAPEIVSKEKKLNKDEIEVVGQYLMYKNIFEDNYTDIITDLKKLHKLFCSCAEYPEYGGSFRDNPAYITGSDVATTPPYLIEIDLIELKNNYSDYLSLDNVEYIKNVSKIHHGITKIHPFNDGNGRVSRALLNYQLVSRGIPPFFISYEKGKKKDYYEGLKKLDKKQNIPQLEAYFYKNIIEMYARLLPYK